MSGGEREGTGEWKLDAMWFCKAVNILNAKVKIHTPAHAEGLFFGILFIVLEDIPMYTLIYWVASK